MVEKSKVTVLMAVHNNSSTLSRAISSIFNQTYKNIDLVCVNDASTDSTLSVLEKEQKKYGANNLRIINNTSNIGLTKSLNTGFDSINAEYTARLDADDWWDQEKISRQVKFLDENPDCGIVGCNYINVSKNKEVKVDTPSSDEEIKKYLIRRNPFSHSCVVFRTEEIRKIGAYDENIRYGQDYELWLRFSQYVKLHNLNEYLCYRNSENGISHDKQTEQMLQCIKTQIRYIKILRRSIIEYGYIIEPLIVIIFPKFLRQLKRKIL